MHRVLNRSFPLSGRLTLRILASLPAWLRETLLFNNTCASIPVQKAVQRLLGGPARVQVQFMDGPLHGYLFDCWTSEKYFFLGGCFEDAVRRVLGELVKEGDVVYDIGAHAGYMALLLSELCGSKGRVYSFEPSSLNFARLKKNIKLNYKQNITALNLAVSDETGVANFSEAGSESCIIITEATASDRPSVVSTVRLDDFVYRDHHEPPCFIKIDVEGYAGHCLAGMKSVLRDVRPRLLCEIHHTREASEVCGIFVRYGYDVTELEPHKQFPRHIVATPYRF